MLKSPGTDPLSVHVVGWLRGQPHSPAARAPGAAKPPPNLYLCRLREQDHCGQHDLFPKRQPRPPAKHIQGAVR